MPRNNYRHPRTNVHMPQGIHPEVMDEGAIRRALETPNIRAWWDIEAVEPGAVVAVSNMPPSAEEIRASEELYPTRLNMETIENATAALVASALNPTADELRPTEADRNLAALTNELAELRRGYEAEVGDRLRPVEEVGERAREWHKYLTIDTSAWGYDMGLNMNVIPDGYKHCVCKVSTVVRRTRAGSAVVCTCGR